MASGTSRNGGSQSPGANLTSNEDAHEHVIDINLQEEPIKQEETWKLKKNPFSPTTTTFNFNPLKLISASGIRKRHAIRPLSNNQSSSMPLQDLQKAIPIRKLPDSVRTYFTANDQLLDDAPILKESVKAVLEGWTSTNRRDKLVASIAVLEDVEKKAKAVHQNQSPMQIKQQSDGESLDAVLGGIVLWKDIYSTIFTSLAGLFGWAGTFIIGKVHPLSVSMRVGGFAAASGASVVSLGVGKRVDSHQDELKIPVEKRKKISKAISGACVFALHHLDDIMESASALMSPAKSMLETMDSGDMESDVVVTGMEVLKQGLQQLETKLDRCIMDANYARQAVVNSTIKNLD